ncbi:MAG: Gfo/Idh/MocA family oxidoreductase [Anaerolineaceae bacterium]|nr:Gfo/Idh/MocA family oxidoreductase [Anaerolineaceae bacterium]
MSNKFRWGILGTGAIAKKFASDLLKLDDAELYAVGSRAQQSADAFAAQFSMPAAHGSYADLIADPGVDAIYVATPHPYHRENTIACLKGKKPVLCEKPFAINHAQAAEMIQTARDEGVFLMEAMWTRFLPVNRAVMGWIGSGQIGQVLHVSADFGFRSTPNPNSRLWNPDLGGGSLLDVGIYPLSYAAMIYGAKPEKIAADAFIGEMNVDEQIAMLLTYADGAQALLRSAIRLSTIQEAVIEGTEGRIIVPDFWHATRAVLYRAGEEPVETTGDAGYQFEAAEVMRCVRAGLPESDGMTHTDTLEIMRVMDEARRQIGLTYPMED